jgi:peptidoglycan/LPS O-acetylase OafA/YrhL
VLSHELTLSQSWVYIVLFGDRLVLDGTFGLSWSLSTEFFFYLSYVVLVPHITRLRKLSGLLIIAGLMSVVVIAAYVYAARHHAEIDSFAGTYLNDHVTDANYGVYRWYFYYSPYARIFEFLLGCLTAQIYALFASRPVSNREIRLGRYLLSGALVYLLVFTLAYKLVPFGEEIETPLRLLKLNYGCAVPIAVIIFCVSRYPSSKMAAALSAPLMILLGDLSYSIYAIHTWTLRIFQRPPMDFHAGLEVEAAFRIAVAVALTIILSSGTYYFIEMPARTWVRRAVSRRLIGWFGPREANTLGEGQAMGASAGRTALWFVVMLVLLTAYQFIVVPHFTSYTR